jgi:tetratricopeptide (TPR) repeat protein
MTSVVDRLERELSAAQGVGGAKYVVVLEHTVEACRTNAAVNGVFDLAELYLELATEYQPLGRFDDALAAAEAAIAAGLVMQPDSRCLRAEILMRAGRVEEANPIWTMVRADSPDDVWLYNNAGLEYADIGEHETALAWLTDGLELALHTNDPERLVEQLAELRATSLQALGQPIDELQQRALSFQHEQAQIRAARKAALESAADSDWSAQEHSDTTVHGVTGLAWAWLPADDYVMALQLWPDLADSALVAGPDGPVPHAQYCRALQAQLVAAAQVGCPQLKVAPLRVAAFRQWCAKHDQTPDSAARAQYVAQRDAANDPTMIPWPPGRNQPCWCGSGRKYKKCCAAPENANTTDADSVGR